MLELDSRRSYLRVGALYLILGAPGAIWAATGGILASRSIVLLVSLLGLPLGVLFLLFGLGKLPRNRRSWYAIRTAVMSLFFAFLLVASLVVVRLGAELFMTSVQFCLMAASYLALLTLVLGAAAALGKEEA